ncbi:Twitchin [Halotydeus destructor]|nr:Twitchin [Halotydeus destructor]
MPPTFITKPEIRQEDGGNRLVFDCILKSKPKPSIKWYRGEEEVTEGDRVAYKLELLSTDKYRVALEIVDVVESDAGLYRVRAKNGLGDVSASISLNFSPSDGPYDV